MAFRKNLVLKRNLYFIGFCELAEAVKKENEASLQRKIFSYLWAFLDMCYMEEEDETSFTATIILTKEKETVSEYNFFVVAEMKASHGNMFQIHCCNDGKIPIFKVVISWALTTDQAKRQESQTGIKGYFQSFEKEEFYKLREKAFLSHKQVECLNVY